MSQEPEDVKPKLNLRLTYDGSEITVKVKPNTKFAKIFQAAEVSWTRTFKFVYDGTRSTKRIRLQRIVFSLNIEDMDQIDCFLEQLGGGLL
ncbi:hypothetical protein B0H17DRAFT_1067276 [Mycena rosella]|uniref:Ubiquitin-like domain-containing protein n=1 Tax=Mycena rosella TaxID=1033263 RepID=A0AAD7DD92_MYCRO|nr:hypothetical protein B0H17DRAFT_1067276 [Mycena rosella]